MINIKERGYFLRMLFIPAPSESRFACFGKTGSHKCVSFYLIVTSGLNDGCKEAIVTGSVTMLYKDTEDVRSLCNSHHSAN